MLSEFEQRELRGIEEMLRSDSRFSARFTERQSRAGRRKARLARALVGSGVFIMVAATVLGLGGAFLQGLGLSLAGLLWTASRSASAARPLRRRRTGRRD